MHHNNLPKWKQWIVKKCWDSAVMHFYNSVWAAADSLSSKYVSSFLILRNIFSWWSRISCTFSVSSFPDPLLNSSASFRCSPWKLTFSKWRSKCLNSVFITSNSFGINPRFLNAWNKNSHNKKECTTMWTKLVPTVNFFVKKYFSIRYYFLQYFVFQHLAFLSSFAKTIQCYNKFQNSLSQQKTNLLP